MELLMNGLLMAATLFAGGYCWVLSRRVKDLKSLDKGLGAAIVTLTRQIELARTTLEELRNKEKTGRKELQSLITKAQDSADALVRVTHSARDAERNLRFQIAQAGERMRHAATPEPEAPATAPAAARPAVQPAAPEARHPPQSADRRRQWRRNRPMTQRTLLPPLQSRRYRSPRKPLPPSRRPPQRRRSRAGGQPCCGFGPRSRARPRRWTFRNPARFPRSATRSATARHCSPSTARKTCWKP